MTKSTLSSAIALFAVCTIPAHAAGKLKVENVVPKIALIGNPQIQATVAGMQPKIVRPGAATETKLWLEVETDFDSTEDFPELTLKYGVLVALPGRPTKLIEGEVTHVDVAKGKERHSVMYISPKTLTKLSEGKVFMPNHIKAAWVEVVAAGETVGAGMLKTSQVTYDQIQKGKDQLEKVSDALLNKQQTPFAPLFVDYFEATKASR